MLSGYIQDMTALVMPKKLGQHDAGEQEHHILSVRFLFFFIAVSEINLWKPLKIVYNRKTEL